MMTEQEKARIRACMEALREGVEGFRSRRPQLEMVAAVANTLARCRAGDEAAGEGDHIAVVEAGTGTGKTFGALVPALVMARSRGKRLVVSSSTVALQHQYGDKDVPTLQRVLPMGFTFAVAKGRRRYACTAKLLAEAQEAGQEELDLTERRAPADDSSDARRRRTIVISLAEQFEAGRWSGDRDELPVPVADEVWGALTTDRQGCAGNKCGEFGRCPFYAAKQRVKEADLVIANHDLVLSALEMEAGSVLPAADETIYVCDEAHSLAAKVVEHFSVKHAMRGAVEWLDGAVEAVRDGVLALRLDDRLLQDARAGAQSARAALGTLYEKVHATRAFEEKKARRFKAGLLPDWAKQLGQQICDGASSLQKTYAQVREALLERSGSEGVLATRVLSSIGFFAGKIDNLVGTWELVLAEDSQDEAPVARWIERHDSSGECDYLVCAAPISGSDRLRKLLWRRASGVVLMSATLTSCGTFDLFLKQSGLSGFAALTLLQVDSPFDYRTKARLVIAGMRTDPATADAHTQEVTDRMPELVNTRGTLVLFASAKQMRSVHAQLPEVLGRITLVQGTMPKMEMLARHRAAIDRGERSVLFGLQSLAEGVDLPGEYCTHVICAKLPFSVPDSPLEEARREWVESQGRSSFIEITVPETAVRLKQQLGRLLRTTEDWGTVTVLDRRLVTKRWGGLLMRGLPDFEVVVERPAGRRSAASSGGSDLKAAAVARA
jgi:ATP-dependent DNA helicase DinG